MMMFEEPMASYQSSAEVSSNGHRFHTLENRDQLRGFQAASPRQSSSAALDYAADLLAAAAMIQAQRDSSKYLDAEVERAMSAFGPRKDTDDEQWSQEKGEAGLDIYSCDQFRMYEFKVRRCMRGRSHDWTECPFAHPGEKARRRDPRKYHYSGTACPDFRKGTCRRGDACEFAHGVFECWLHPARYHTQPCKDGLKCRRRVCFFAHTPEQLRLLPAAAAAANHADKPSANLSAKQGSPTKRNMASPTSILVGQTAISPPPVTSPASPPCSPDNNFSPIQPGSPASNQPFYNSNPAFGGGQSVPPMSPLGHAAVAPFSPHHSYRASNYPSNQMHSSNQMPPRSQAQMGTPRLERPASLPPRLQLPSIEEQLQQAHYAAALVAASQSPASTPIPIGGGRSGDHMDDDSHHRMAEILAAHLRQLEVRGASTPGARWQYPHSPQHSQRSSFDLPHSQRSSFDYPPSQRCSFDMGGYQEKRRGSVDLGQSSHRESIDFGSRRSSFDYAHFASPAVRRTISVPASPATRPSNPWDAAAAAEADYQLPQRVESGKDLRASIYGRLGGNGQGNGEGGEQPDLQWVNDLVQEGGDKQWTR